MIVQRISARKLTELLGSWRGEGHSYLELSESIGLLVRDGRLVPGAALPAERPLSEALGISRTTVSASYQRLRETGVAASRRGSGTVIRSSRRENTELWVGPVGSGVDFSAACPAPWGGIEALTARALVDHPEIFKLSGYDTIGLPSLRSAIADRYTARGLPTTPEQIMVTLGAQHAIFLIARTLLRRGDRSLIESPSYPHAREALAAAGALIAEMPVGIQGHDAAAMLDIAARTTPRLAYLIPDHHNPTGLSMPPELRAQLIATLAAQGAYTLVDETTAELTLNEPRRITPFAAFADQLHQQDSIITVGSLGKTVWGGLRVGWIRAAPDLIDRLETARRVGDLGTGTWEQVIALLALEQYDEILAERTQQLTAQHHALTEQLGSLLPSWSISPAEGGACVWVDLGEPVSSRLCKHSARLGLKLVPGPRFGSPGTFERYVRLPFTEPVEKVIEGAGLLHAAWQQSGEPAAAMSLPGSVI